MNARTRKTRTKIAAALIAITGFTASFASTALASVTDGNGNYINGGNCRQLVDPQYRDELRFNKSLVINVVGPDSEVDSHAPQGSGAGCGDFPG